MSRSVIASALLLFFLVSSCTPYRKITFSKTEVFKKKRVSDNIDRYDVVVHKNDSVYLLNNPTIENETLSGTLTAVPNPEAYQAKEQEDEISEEEMNDLHVFMTDQTEGISNGASVQFDEDEVVKTEMYGKETEGVAGTALTVLLIVLGLIVILVLILVLAIANAAKNASGSNSGGSDSGGSDSGCYIATMAYGSYDAPQVLILRQFRDRFLQKFGAGRSFISWYYANSPSFVAKHRSKKWLHTTLRLLLSGFVVLLKPIFRIR